MSETKPDQDAPTGGTGPRRGGLGQVVMLGTNVAVGMTLFTLLGYYIDSKRGGGHGWTVAGAILGFLYGGYEFWKTIRMLNESGETADRDHVRGRKEPGQDDA